LGSYSRLYDIYADLLSNLDSELEALSEALTKQADFHLLLSICVVGNNLD
tara:strand:- start:1023 stop:1172 length:150 start_codon:yes stop_codon:yes gene_type:complete